MQKTLFGKLSTNEEIYSYRLENSEIYAEIITYGAIIKSFSRVGSYNIVGSFDTLEDYLADKTRTTYIFFMRFCVFLVLNEHCRGGPFKMAVL